MAGLPTQPFSSPCSTILPGASYSRLIVRLKLPMSTTQDIIPFIKLEYGRIGADQNITPREVIRDFIELLDILYQNPDMGIEELMQSDGFTYAKSEAVSDKTEKNYAEFEI